LIDAALTRGSSLEDIMQPSTRRAALRAAAKLAFGVTFGCGGQTVGQEAAPDAAPAEPAASVTAAPPASPPPTATPAPVTSATPAPSTPIPDDVACVGPVQLDLVASSPVSEAEFECCFDYTQARVAEGPDADLTPDPDFVNCCAAVIAGVQHDFSKYNRVMLEPLRSVCCFDGIVAPAQDMYSYSLCTPWGPPVPPAWDDSELGAVA
jgi:hypothetical protein